MNNSPKAIEELLRKFCINYQLSMQNFS